MTGPAAEAARFPAAGDVLPPDPPARPEPPLWVACEATTGRIIEYFPTLLCDWPLKQTIGRYETATAHLPVVAGRTPPVDSWMRATKPGASFWAALARTPGSRVYDSVLWAGIGLTRTRKLDSGSGSRVVDLSLSTVEAYFDRRYVGFLQVATMQDLIVKQIVETYVRAGALPGLPIRVVTSGSATQRALAWQDTDDKTVYSVLQSLSGLLGGPEWTVGWELQTNPERVTPVLFTGDRIGQAAPGGVPAATFELLPGGAVTAVSYVEDYAPGKGANDVLATSNGQGSARAQSNRVRAVNYDNRPTFELRFTPDTSQQQREILDAHATSALQLLAPGQRAVTLTADTARAPRLGVDWKLGDDVGFDLYDELLFPDHPKGVGRAIGWQLSPSQVSPILAVPDPS